MERKYSKWCNYTIEIKSDILQKVKDFVPVDADKAKNKSFQLRKNHINNCTFREKENMERKQIIYQMNNQKYQ